MNIDRTHYNHDDALQAAGHHLMEVIRHYREAASIIQQHQLAVALPPEQPLLETFCECQLQRKNISRA